MRFEEFYEIRSEKDRVEKEIYLNTPVEHICNGLIRAGVKRKDGGFKYPARARNMKKNALDAIKRYRNRNPQLASAIQACLQKNGYGKLGQGDLKGFAGDGGYSDYAKGKGTGTGVGTGTGNNIFGKGTGDGNIPGYTPGDGTAVVGANSGKGNADSGTSTTGKGNSDTGTEGYATESGKLNSYLQNEDWEGALNYLDGNPGFEDYIGPSFRKDIEGTIDAIEAKKKALAAAEKAALEQQIADEQKAEEARIAAENERIANKKAAKKAEEERLAKEEALKKAEEARIAKEKAEKARLEAEAEKKRIEAERLEKERKEKEEEANRIKKDTEQNPNITVKPDDKEKPVKPDDIDDFDWEDLQ